MSDGRILVLRTEMVILEEALRLLANEVGGITSCYEHELRSVMGNTNFNALVERHKQAIDVLGGNR